MAKKNKRSSTVSLNLRVRNSEISWMKREKSNLQNKITQIEFIHAILLNKINNSILREERKTPKQARAHF